MKIFVYRPLYKFNMKKQKKSLQKNKYLQAKANAQLRDSFGRFIKRKKAIGKSIPSSKKNLKKPSKVSKINLAKNKVIINQKPKLTKQPAVTTKFVTQLKTEKVKSNSLEQKSKLKTKASINYSFWLKLLSLLLSVLSVGYYSQRFLRFNGLNIVGLTTVFRNLNLFPDTNYQLMISLNPTAGILLDFLFIVMAIVVVVNFLVALITMLSIREWFIPNLISSSLEAATILLILITLFIFFEFNVFALLTYLGLFFMLAFSIMKIGTTVWNYFVKED